MTHAADHTSQTTPTTRGAIMDHDPDPHDDLERRLALLEAGEPGMVQQDLPLRDLVLLVVGLVLVSIALLAWAL